MALEIFKLAGSIFVDSESAQKSMAKTDKQAEGVGNRLASVAQTAGKWGAAIGAGAVAAGAAIVAVANNTREYRTEMGKLETAFTSAGFSSENATESYKSLQAVLGDSGQAVEAAGHIAQMAQSEQDLQNWTQICTGVFATFGDSLPIEGLTEAANETAKVGQVTGSLADALNWAGVSEDDFNKKLEGLSTEQERQALITSTLNGLYSESANKYREVNGEVMNANAAQESLAAAMAKIGAAVEPIVTSLTGSFAQIVESLTPFISSLATGIIPPFMQLIETIMPMLISLIETIMPILTDIINAIMPVLIDLLSTILPPLFEIVEAILPLLLSLIEPLLPLLQPILDLLQPLIDLLVTIIQPLAELLNAILPPLIEVIVAVLQKAIEPLQGGLEVLASILTDSVKFAFEQLSPVIQSVQNIFNSLLDFINNVFSGNWEGAWQNVKDIFVNIVEGLGNAFKYPLNSIIRGINGFISGLNRIQIPDWVPLVGGKGLNIPQIPLLANGGVLYDGSAIVGEAGAELLTVKNGKATVRPLHSGDTQDQDSKSKITINNYITATPSTAFEVSERTRKTLKRLELQGAL